MTKSIWYTRCKPATCTVKDKCKQQQQCSICISFLKQTHMLAFAGQAPASHSTSPTAAWSVSKSSQTRSHFPPPQPAILSAHEPDEPNRLLQNRLTVETRPCWPRSSSRQPYPILHSTNIHIYAIMSNLKLKKEEPLKFTITACIPILCSAMQKKEVCDQMTAMPL